MLLFETYLPPANEVWGKLIFLHQFVILFTGGGVRGCLGGHAWFNWGACMVAPGGAGGHAWFYSGGRAWLLLGEHAWLLGWGHAWFYSGGHAWFYLGGMHGFIQGVCMVLFGGRAWFYSGGHAWFFQFFRIQWDTVNERAVRILLECILVNSCMLLCLC